jgi:hypothetical protein
MRAVMFNINEVVRLILVRVQQGGLTLGMIIMILAT